MNATKRRLVVTSLAVLMAGTGAASMAQVGSAKQAATSGTASDSEETRDALIRVDKAVQVLQQMQATPEMRSLLQRSKGVYVVPDFGNAALGVGARGGAGVLLVRKGDTWANPAFYNYGGVTIGFQAGAEAGAIAFVLNDQKALDSFMQDNKFSLNADAGLTLVDWSKKGAGAAGWGNITVWSDTEGLFGGAALSVADIDYDETETAAYYGRRVAAREVVTGKVPNPQAASLRKALASISGGSGASSTGGSETGASTSSGKASNGSKSTSSEADRERTR